MQDTVSKIALAAVAIACVIAVIVIGGGSTTAARLVDVVLVAVGALGGGLAQSLLTRAKPIVEAEPLQPVSSEPVSETPIMTLPDPMGVSSVSPSI
jgi:hypothetical protein